MSEFDFDKMYRRDAHGTVGGVAWRPIKFAKYDEEYELPDGLVDQFIDEGNLSQQIEICGVKFWPSDILKEMDPIAYHQVELDIYDAESEDYEQPDNEDQVIFIMVGDDREFTFDVDEMIPIEDDEYCSECGQIGCGHAIVN